MSNTQNVPASLIEQLGTGEDTLGLVGKRIRMTKDPAEGLSPIVQLITGLSSLPVGSEATVIHVDGDGHYWADFGDTEEREFEVIE